MTCRYKEKTKCLLLTKAIDNNGGGIPISWCDNYCQPNHIPAQLAILKRFGFELPPPPKDKDLLEWVQECIANGTAKLTPQAETIQKQKAEQTKAIAQLPSWFVKIKWAHKHAGQILAHKIKTKGRIRVTPGQKATRLAICDDCEKLWVNPKTQNKRCSECGCHLAEIAGIELGKADFEALKCKNWPDIALGG